MIVMGLFDLAFYRDGVAAGDGHVAGQRTYDVFYVIFEKFDQLFCLGGLLVEGDSHRESFWE